MAKQQQPDGLQNLKNSLRAKELDRLYVFCGEEVFLLNHYLGQIKKLLLDDLTESFNFHKLNQEDFSVESFLNAVENMPMMAEHTLVHVDEVDLFKLPEDDRSKIAETLSDIPDYCTIVFTYETVEWKPDKRQKQLWEAVSRNGTIVEFAKQGQRELSSWVTRHFAAAGKSISLELCAYLIDLTGGTMTALAGEIQKIVAYSGTQEIQKSDIDAVTEPVLDAVVFQMTDLMAQGNFGGALQKLQQLLKMQQEPLSILGAVGNHFRRLGAARILQQNGRGVGDLASLYGMSEYPARKTMDAARRFPPEFCKQAVELVMQTDYQIKTSYDEPERLLELLVLRLAQEVRRG